MGTDRGRDAVLVEERLGTQGSGARTESGWMRDEQGNLVQNQRFGGKNQQRESCNSAFFVKKTNKQNPKT